MAMRKKKTSRAQITIPLRILHTRVDVVHSVKEKMLIICGHVFF